MTEEIIETYKRDLQDVLLRWKEALEQSHNSDMARDSAILRFELAFEVSWKLIQRLARHEGYEVNSPRQAFRQAFTLGWIDDEEIWDDILRDRNAAIHVYRKEFAEKLAGRLPDYYAAILHLSERISQ